MKSFGFVAAILIAIIVIALVFTDRDLISRFKFSYETACVCNCSSPCEISNSTSPPLETNSTKNTICNWPQKIWKHAAQNYSQGLQDGIVDFIFQNIGVKHRYFVEFGFDGPSWAFPRTPNTRNLHEQGWTGMFGYKRQETF